jgi:hypothetical protein
MLLREQLTRDFAGLLLDSIRDNGLKTSVSDDAGINRNSLNRKGLAEMKLHQLLRLLVALCHHQSRFSAQTFFKLWMKMGKVIYQMADEHFFEMCNERRGL